MGMNSYPFQHLSELHADYREDLLTYLCLINFSIFSPEAGEGTPPVGQVEDGTDPEGRLLLLLLLEPLFTTLPFELSAAQPLHRGGTSTKQHGTQSSGVCWRHKRSQVTAKS